MSELYADTRIICLNSQFSTPAVTRGDYTKSYLSDVLFNTKDVLRADPNILYSTVALHQCQIPVSFYNINYTCNVLQVQVGAVITLLTLTKGNYNIAQLITHIKTLFLTLSTPITMVITLDRPTGKLTFSNNTYNFSFLAGGSTILEVLGFDSVSSYISSGFLLTADHPASLLGVKLLKICSSALSTNAISSALNNNFSQMNILGLIPVNAVPFSLLSFHNNASSYPILANKTVDAIDIKIFDENNRYVNMNNVEWSISLAITSYKKLPNFQYATISDFRRSPDPDPVSDPVLGADEPVVPLDTPLPRNIEDHSRDLDFLLYEKGIEVP